MRKQKTESLEAVHTHTHTGVFRKQKNKNEKNKKPIIIEFNLSKSVAVITLIVVIVMAITTKEVVETIIEAKEQKALANESGTTTGDENVTWVKSTTTDENGNETVETDSNGNEVTVPVPKGYTASKIDGETTASKGFVIYEGDVDWSTILVDSGDTESTNVASLGETASSEASDLSADTTSTEDTSITTNESADEVATTTEENTITETTTTVTQEEINIFNLQKSINQYVWVPVENVNDIYGIDEDGKLWGKLYNFVLSQITSLNWTETNGIISIKDKTGAREPDVMSYVTSGDSDTYLAKNGLDNQTRYELLSQGMEQDFYNMIESIKKYGGFYIGRYETGKQSENVVVVRKMDTDIEEISWYGGYKKLKKLNGKNENVTTSMIWGSLYDETLKWLVKTGSLTASQVAYNSVSWGNAYNSTFTYIDENATEPIETKKKENCVSTLIPTGSSSYTKVNNIYDLSGNTNTWTMESNGGGVVRGGERGASRNRWVCRT